MALRDVLEIVFSYIQYFILLVSINPSPFPDYFRTPLDILRYLNLDTTLLLDRDQGALRDELPQSWPFDVRLQFIFVSVVLPLLLALTGLLSLAPKHFILWYTILLAAIFCVVIAIFALGVNDPLVIRAVGSTNIYILLYSGCGGLVACIATAVGWRFYSRGREAELEHRTYEEIMQDEVGKIDWPAVLFRLIYFAGLTFLGLLLIGAFEVSFIMRRGSLGVVGIGLGATCLTFAAVLLVWTVVSFSEAGRLIQFKVGEVVKNNFLSVLLLLISLLYIPAVSNVVLVINCRDVTCDRYLRFADAGSAIAPDWEAVRSPAGFCEKCVFELPQACPTALQDHLCANAKAYKRLYRSPTVRCDDLEEYFWPASGIMFFSYVLAMPAINFVLTQRSTKVIENEFPLDARESAGMTDQEAFDEKVHMSNNAAKFIYDPFQMRWKHWRMLFLMQKLFTVLAAVFVFETSDINSAQMGLGLSLFVHILCFLYIVITRPFKRKVENFVTIATQLMLVVASGVGVAGTQGVSPPDVVWLCVAGCSGGIPLLALIVGSLLTVRDTRRKVEARQRRIDRAIAAIEQAEDEELEDLYQSEDEEGTDSMHGTLRGLPSSQRLKPERATQRVKVQSAVAVPSSGVDSLKMSAAARRRENTNTKRTNAQSTSLSPKNNNSTSTGDAGESVSLTRHPQPPVLSPSGNDDLVIETVESDDEVTVDFTPSDNRALVSHRRGGGQQTTAAASPTSRFAGVKTAENNAGVEHGAAKPLDFSRVGGAAAASKSTASGKAVVGRKLGRGAPPPIEPNPLSPPPVAIQPPSDVSPAAAITIDAGPSDSTARSTQSKPTLAGTAARRRRNTPAQSINARRRWAQAKVHVLRIVREEMLRREEEDDDEDDTAVEESYSPTSGRAIPKPKKKKQKKKMDGWNKLVIMLMKNDAKKHAERKAKARGTNATIEMSATLNRIDSNLRKQSSIDDADINHVYERHLERVHNEQAAVDFRINEDTTGMLHIFFMVIGMFAFVALGCCTLGVIDYGESNYLLSSDATAETVAYQLADFRSWADFTSECCCIRHQNLTESRVVDLEKWICSNGYVKERVRRVTNIPLHAITAANAQSVSYTDGYAVRGLCSATFDASSGCEIEVVPGSDQIRLVGCSATIPPSERGLW